MNTNTVWKELVSDINFILSIFRLTRPRLYIVFAGRCLWHLDPGLVSNHQHALAQRTLSGSARVQGQEPSAEQIVGHDRSPISIIYYPKAHG